MKGTVYMSQQRESWISFTIPVSFQIFGSIQIYFGKWQTNKQRQKVASKLHNL